MASSTPELRYTWPLLSLRALKSYRLYICIQRMLTVWSCVSAEQSCRLQAGALLLLASRTNQQSGKTLLVEAVKSLCIRKEMMGYQAGGYVQILPHKYWDAHFYVPICGNGCEVVAGWWSPLSQLPWRHFDVIWSACSSALCVSKPSVHAFRLVLHSGWSASMSHRVYRGFHPQQS